MEKKTAEDIVHELNRYQWTIKEEIQEAYDTVGINDDFSCPIWFETVEDWVNNTGSEFKGPESFEIVMCGFYLDEPQFFSVEDPPTESNIDEWYNESDLSWARDVNNLNAERARLENYGLEMYSINVRQVRARDSMGYSVENVYRLIIEGEHETVELDVDEAQAFTEADLKALMAE